MALSPGGAKAKGATAERELAAVLAGWAWEAGFKLSLERNLEQTRGGGFDLNGGPRLAIECKRVETLAIPAWWAQAVRQAGDDLIPFLAYRQNKKQWAFRIRVEIYHAGPDGSALIKYDADMTYAEAKKWFMSHLWFHRSALEPIKKEA